MVLASTLVAAAASTISPVGATSSTFDDVYHQSRPTPIVYVQPGNYPAQRLTKGGRRVVFVARGRVTIGGVELEGASSVEFRGTTIAGWTADAANHITFRNVKTVGDFYINAPSSWISILGGSVGPSHNHDSYIAVPDDSIKTPSRHIVIDGVRFHDVTRDPGEHVECLMLAQGIDVTIRNSTFVNCSVFDLFITWWEFRPAVPPPADVHIVNNRFEHTSDGYFSFHWADVVATGGRKWTGYVIRGNTCGQRADFTSAAPRAGFVVAGNHGC